MMPWKDMVPHLHDQVTAPLEEVERNIMGSFRRRVEVRRDALRVFGFFGDCVKACKFFEVLSARKAPVLVTWAGLETAEASLAEASCGESMG